MQPWMVIAALLAGCVALLIVAPRLHRRSLARGLAKAEQIRARRIDELRRRPDSVETPVPESVSATAVRDALLLRGVRVEIVAVPGSTALVHRPEDTPTVRDVLAGWSRPGG